MTGLNRFALRAHPSAILAACALAGSFAATATSILADPPAAGSGAIHPVSSTAAMETRLSHVPVTHDFPPDFAATLRSQATAFMIETTSEPGCIPCGDTWTKLQHLARRYALRVAVLSREEALTRSGKFGLPWAGHPVVWVRAVDDQRRIVPVAIGTDHEANTARNIYLAFKMIRGVRPAIAVRGMARFTGIVGAGARHRSPMPRQ